jgi:hypothetical protein
MRKRLNAIDRCIALPVTKIQPNEDNCLRNIMMVLTFVVGGVGQKRGPRIDPIQESDL